MAVNLSTCKKLLALLVAALACITWAEGAPVTPDTDASSNETATTHEFEFSAPNCSLLEPADANLNNRTHLDFAIGLYVLKTYLKGVLSDLNMTVTMEDGESFVPCPAPVDTLRLREYKPLGGSQTEVGHLAAWYGVLAAYAQYGTELLEDDNALLPQAEKKITTVLEMLKSVLHLFSDVIGPRTCTTEFDVPTYEYTDDPVCSRNFNTLKYATNMISHLQTAVSDTREVQRNWYIASSIGIYLQKSLVRELRPTWISRYTTTC